jgi:hypothetical protein
MFSVSATTALIIITTIIKKQDSAYVACPASMQEALFC